MSVTCCFFHVYSLEFIPWLYSSILPEDYVHVKEIITADATQIPVGDQITQPALRLLKILSQVFAIQRSFLKKKFLGFVHTTLFSLLVFAAGSWGICRHTRRRGWGKLGSEKIPPAGTNGWEPSCEEMNFLRKGKASAACSSGLPLVADVAVFAMFIMSTVNGILYNSLISIQSLLAILPMQGAKRANCFLILTVSWKYKKCLIFMLIHPDCK